MVPLSPQLLIATMRALAGVGVRGEPSPDVVRPTLRLCTTDDDVTPDESWDAEFIYHCGYWSHYDHRSRQSSWPVPKGLNTVQLGEFGSARGLLHEVPRAGDIFLQFSLYEERFIHSGVVTDILGRVEMGKSGPEFELYCIEGDTDEAARRRGNKAMRATRWLSAARGDRFLRWPDLAASGWAVLREDAGAVDTRRIDAC